MSKYTYVAIFGLLMSLSSVASAESNDFPSDFMYSSNPIDALCFSNLENNTSIIHLQDCGLTKDNYLKNGENDKLVQRGFIGFNWEDKTNHAQGYSYYKIFPAGNSQYWLYAVNGSGGSGEFTTINLVRRNNEDSLKIDTYAEGDRCNGGIQDAVEKKHQLTFSVNLTPADFLTLTKDNPHHIKAYEDLAACAACCIAKAYYEVEPGYDPELKYVDLGKRGSAGEMPDQGLHEACFNKLVSSYIAKGKIKLDYLNLKKFVGEFNQTCIKE